MQGSRNTKYRRNPRTLALAASDSRGRQALARRVRGATLGELRERWLESRRADGASVSTLSLYAYSSELLLDFCRECEIVYPDELRTRDLDRLAIDLQQRPQARYPEKKLSATSIASYMRTLGYFVHWLVDEQHIEQANAPVVPRPRVPKMIVDTLDSAALRKLCDAPDLERDRLILRVLTTTGMRALELCKLTLDDVRRHGSGYFLKVHGKGARDRLVPIMPTLFNALRQYAKHDRPACEHDRLFVSMRREGVVGHDFFGDYPPLSTSGVRQLVKKAAAKAGIDQNVYTHLLRHSFATERLRSHVDSMTVASVMGHSNTTMLQKTYGHLTAQDAYETIVASLREDDERLKRWRRVTR